MEVTSCSRRSTACVLARTFWSRASRLFSFGSVLVCHGTFPVDAYPNLPAFRQLIKQTGVLGELIVGFTETFKDQRLSHIVYVMLLAASAESTRLSTRSSSWLALRTRWQISRGPMSFCPYHRSAQQASSSRSV